MTPHKELSSISFQPDILGTLPYMIPTALQYDMCPIVSPYNKEVLIALSVAFPVYKAYHYYIYWYKVCAELRTDKCS